MKYLFVILLFCPLAYAADATKVQQAVVTIRLPAAGAALPATIADAVAVIGSVNAPQPVKTDRAISVLAAIEAAGGLSRLSSQIEFIVIDANGVTTHWRTPSIRTEEGKAIYSRVLVQPGDILSIPELCYF